MRVLHVVKTSEGARWAALQAGELVKAGVDVHVALPERKGACVEEWTRSGATLHFAQLDFPVRAPWNVRAVCARARQLVADIGPDILHSHSVGTTLVLRLALGRAHPTPRVFQVPGPLHLEHPVFRTGELASAGPSDVWIASSRCIADHYAAAGIPDTKVFVSYYGTRIDTFAPKPTGALREMLDIPAGALIVGNINFMYAPKYYLGQRVGLKCHEDVIDALAMVTAERRDVVGVLIGGAWAGATGYEQRLKERARRKAGDRIKVPGYLASSAVQKVWADFDCAVHVPMSENCGGVLEPLLCGVPTIASRVGGLPEVVIDSLTGKTVEPRRPDQLAAAIRSVLDDLPHHRSLAEQGRALVTRMFDVRRTAGEVHQIYRHLLDGTNAAPAPFDSRRFLSGGHAIESVA